jgi:hypothetical protein
MAMTKDQLLKLAEHGVRQRLSELQAEINELAEQFPHIVGNQDGSVPAVLPLTMKTKQVRQTKTADERRAEIRRTLTTHPGSTTAQLAAMLHVHKSTAYAFVRQVARSERSRTGHRSEPGRWFLKGAQAAQGATKSKRPRVDAVPAAERLAVLRLFLAKHPHATTTEVIDHLQVSKNRTLMLLHRIAKKNTDYSPGNGGPATWVLKNDTRKRKPAAPKATKTAKSTKRATWSPEARKRFAKRMRKVWASYTPEQRLARGARAHHRPTNVPLMNNTSSEHVGQEVQPS